MSIPPVGPADRPSPTTVGSDACRDFASSSKLEWLETNGNGAFAMGTVSGLNTRGYHGLLIASLRPPVERFLLLAHMEEQVTTHDQTFGLSACQYPGTLAIRGFELLESFTPEPHARWVYRLGNVVFEREVYLVPGKQAVVVRYRASEPVVLGVRPFLAYRDYHSQAHENDLLNQNVEIEEGYVRMTPYGGLPALELFSNGTFAPQPLWYRNFEHAEETARGLPDREDLFTPGVLTLQLQPRQWTHICGSIEGPQPLDPPPAIRDPFLVWRADDRPTIIAGYPWFTDWGRDTMISIPGLLIATGRLDEARQIIEGFLQYLDQGLIPNRFPDAGEQPEYNTADATLWMFQAVRIWLGAGGDRAFLQEVFYPAAKEIVAWHMKGTRFGIGVDPQDGLLNAGTPGTQPTTQLTWMDAKIGDRVVTPRQGKPVEINALWHGALSSMAEWAEEIGDLQGTAEFRNAAAQAKASFSARFWNEAGQCLYDVVTDHEPVDRHVDKLRPNQIFAVSLPYDLLLPEQEIAVVQKVERELLTPMGLRTLATFDPEYRGRYEGSVVDRDSAYHQGTVWPWLLGPYIDAYLRAMGETPATLAYCRSLLHALEVESQTRGCLGSVAEIYDGDEPRLPRGCPAQAWSVAELARVRWQYGL